MKDLYTYLENQDVFRERWETRRKLIGGSTTSLDVSVHGREYQVPNISEIKDADKEQVEEIMDSIREYVPESIWEEVADRQAQKEKGYGD